MSERDPKTSGWRIAVAVVVLALLACGILIFLAVRKVAVEQKVERKFSPNGTVPKPTPKLPALERQPDREPDN